MTSAEQELNLQGWEQWKNGSSASPWCVTVWTKQPNKPTKGFWCLLAMDRTNFSCSKFFLGHIEVHWKCTEYISMYWDTLKKNHKSNFGWELALTVEWAQKVSATILVSSSLLQIRRPISNFSSAQFTSITVQLHHYYNNFSPCPQSAFVKRENGTASFTLRETEAHRDKTFLSPCRLALESRAEQSSRISGAWCQEGSVPCTRRSQFGLRPILELDFCHTHGCHLWGSLRGQSWNSTWLHWVSLDSSIIPLLYFIFNNLPFPDHHPTLTLLCNFSALL